MNIVRNSFRFAVAASLAATLGACAVYDTAPPTEGPYYESYGYPDSYGGPGYYGPGYYQPGYYGGYWYGGGYYQPVPGGYYAPYPYYPGTHVVIVDRERSRPREPERQSVDGDTRKIYKSTHDPVPPQANERDREPPRPFGIPNQLNDGNERPTRAPAPTVKLPYGAAPQRAPVANLPYGAGQRAPVVQVPPQPNRPPAPLRPQPRDQSPDDQRDLPSPPSRGGGRLGLPRVQER